MEKAWRTEIYRIDASSIRVRHGCRPDAVGLCGVCTIALTTPRRVQLGRFSQGGVGERVRIYAFLTGKPERNDRPVLHDHRLRMGWAGLGWSALVCAESRPHLQGNTPEPVARI